MTEPQYLLAVNLTDRTDAQLLQIYRQMRLLSAMLCIIGIGLFLFGTCALGGVLANLQIFADLVQDPLVKITLGVSTCFVGLTDLGLAYFMFMPRANAAKAEMERRGLTVVS